MNTPQTASQEWFEMGDLRKRRFGSAVWIPLRASVTTESPDWAEYNRVGASQEVFTLGSLAIPVSKKDEGNKLGWTDIGLGHTTGPYAFPDGGYKPAEIYQFRDGEDLGIELVLEQHVPGEASIWHLNQDLMLALGLIQEQDSWIRPEENYTTVVRQKRNKDGSVNFIEIRSEFLRDYLAARGLALRVSSYRERAAVLANRPPFTWPDGSVQVDEGDDRFTANITETDKRGWLLGGVAIFRIWRTDVDPEEDVPILGPENNTNVASESKQFERGGPLFYRVQGRFWRNEWIEPAERSERVRGDKTTNSISFIVDASGKTELSEALNSEDVGRYLWFDPRVICTVIDRRGGGLEWYTGDTGSVSCSPGYETHFGVNGIGLITVYAYDIAKLPAWQQKIWAGHNIAPDGQVSKELLDSQVLAKPAETTAPEFALPRLMDEVDSIVQRWLGANLFRQHDATRELVRSVHRFRAIDRHGLLALAKDVTRLITDRIDEKLLHPVAPPPPKVQWRSLKSLEMALATCVPYAQATRILSPLAGIYELRLGDAHLPSEAIDEAFGLIGLDLSAPMVIQGQQLLQATVRTLAWVAFSIDHQINPPSGEEGSA